MNPKAWEAFAAAGLPDYMRAGIERYVDHGVQPGRFLSCLLMWDFNEARYAADPVNVRKLHAYEDWMREWLPPECWGSPEIVRAWRASKAQQEVA
jgi:hypothetical protein